MFFLLNRGVMPKITIIQVGTGKKANIPSTFTNLSKQIINDCWNFKLQNRQSFERILHLFESNDYMLLDSDKSEISKVRNFVKQHKTKVESIYTFFCKHLNISSHNIMQIKQNEIYFNIVYIIVLFFFFRKYGNLLLWNNIFRHICLFFFHSF